MKIIFKLFIILVIIGICLQIQKHKIIKNIKIENISNNTITLNIENQINNYEFKN